MNSISSSKNGTLLLVIALAMALLFAVYYYVIKPKEDEAQAIRTEITSLETEISTMEQSLAELNVQHSQTDINEFALRKKVPANREIDALILAMEEIEYVTGSRVQSIEFNNYDALVSSSGLQDPLYTPEPEEGTAAEDGSVSSETTETAESTESTESTDGTEPSREYRNNRWRSTDRRTADFHNCGRNIAAIVKTGDIQCKCSGTERCESTAVYRGNRKKRTCHAN